MKYSKFVIKKYKGIDELEFDLNILPDNKVYPLVGLNESGKTTILEAINDYEFPVSKLNAHELIPKKMSGGFSGDISIDTELELDDQDVNFIKKFLSENNIKYADIKIPNIVKRTRKYFFNNSIPKSEEYTKLTRDFKIKIKKTQNSKSYIDLGADIETKLWEALKEYSLPEIIFYRDFLSKFPDKIELEPIENDYKNVEYKNIIVDVLNSIDKSFSIQENITNRLDQNDDANRSALESVENKMGAKISEIVFDAWNKIKQTSKKDVVVKAFIDPVDGKKYISLKIKEGSDSFTLNQRSLGFRWFFTYLLYTEFRKARIKNNKEILFLLDEPASNLHQTAQHSILDTFKKIIKNKSRLIYATHSHHLLSPDWIDTTYIIKNKGLDYNNENSFNSSQTDIIAIKYKQFVSTYPTETTYFQPVLDVLDYQPGLLEMFPEVIITEGKFDYFIFRYINEIILKNKYLLHFYPAKGAGDFDLPIALYESFGRKYVGVLDGDPKGEREKKRYCEQYNIDCIFTLKDILQRNNIVTEDLFTDEEKIEISKVFNYNLNSYEKSSFNSGIKTLLNKKQKIELDSNTINNFDSVFSFLLENLNSSNGINI